MARKNQKCLCSKLANLKKSMEKNSKKFKKVPSLFIYYRTILYDIKWRNNNIVNCSVCSNPHLVEEIMYNILTPNGEIISPEMTFSAKENFRQYLTEKYVRKSNKTR